MARPRANRLVTISTATVGIAVLMLGLGANSVAQAVEQTSACSDGGGTAWSTMTHWGGTYVDASGTTRVTNNYVAWTTNHEWRPTQTTVRTYDGSGKLLQTLFRERGFDYNAGTSRDARNPLDPPSSPGRAKVVLTVGTDGDGKSDCTVTFVQPAATAPPASADSIPLGDVVSDGVKWRQVLSEDFNSATRPAGWHPYADGPCCDNKYNDLGRVTYHDGLMDVAIADSQGTLQGTAGQFGNTQTSMRTALRFRTDKPFSGAGEANMIWPTDDVWGNGEIDWPETQFNSTIGGFVHQVGAHPEVNSLYVDTGVTPSSGWHTAVTEWKPGSFVRFYLDGRMVGEDTRNVPTTPHDWRFQTADNGEATSNGGHFQIAWVAQWVLG